MSGSAIVEEVLAGLGSEEQPSKKVKTASACELCGALPEACIMKGTAMGSLAKAHRPKTSFKHCSGL